MIPKGSKLCEDCQALGNDCKCVCHTTDYIKCQHVRVWEEPSSIRGGKYFHWLFRLLNKRHGLRYETF